MLVRYTIENYKSIDKKQELVMIPSKKMVKHSNHVMKMDNIKLLKNATVYGANASGKSNLIESISFMKYVIVKKIPIEATSFYCRNISENMNKETIFEMEIYKNKKVYAYGFSLVLKELKVIKEWLYELVPNKKDGMMIFEREASEKTINIGKGITLSKNELARLNTYIVDFKENNSGLFLQEMNRQKKIDDSSSFIIFKDVYEWFVNDLTIIFPNQLITSFKYFYSEKSADKINQMLKVFDTGISRVSITEITMADFKSSLPSKIVDDIFKNYYDQIEKNDINKKHRFTFRTYNEFYSLEGKKGEQPRITTIKLKHGNAYSDFEFGEESDGTRRLFDLIDILVNEYENKVYIIDELDRSLHPKITEGFLKTFFKYLENKKVQLILTTHESAIMDQELLRRDEIWFIERNSNNETKLYSLDRFKVRYDKKISKAYLDGRYGAIPILKELCKDEIS